MANNGRKKANTPTAQAKSSQNSKKICGRRRREILEQTSISAVYHKDAVVKKDDDGLLHIYYGGLGAKQYHFHGHMILNADGSVRYHRLPFAKHCEAERYSDGIVQRGRNFKRHFCY